MNNERTQVKLVAHGLQKKGKSEYGPVIMGKIGLPLGEMELNDFVANPHKIPNEWCGWVPIFWRSINLHKSGIETSNTIPTIESWVKGMVFSAGLWHIESFPVDDDFSPNRLSVEMVPIAWWRWWFYKLTGKKI